VKKKGSPMTISVTEAIKQNTLGMSEGLPQGVPTDYSWYQGADQGADVPPLDFTSVGGWGQVYPEQGSSYSNPGATIDVANAQTWVHLKATNQWVQVQSQSNDPLEGGHFVADFAGNAATAMTVSTLADGTSVMPVPPAGYNDHFWHVGRGQFDPGAVDGVYVQMDMKVSDPNLKVVANIGADWWRTPTADYVDGFSNNPGAGMSNWVELTGQYKTLAFFSGSAAEFQANPPPALTGAIVTDPPVATGTPGTESSTPVVTNPVDPTSGASTDPTNTQTAGTNLLKNGSFEDTALGQGQVGIYGKIDGWTAKSGSKIELWNNVSGVNATDGHNFSELDYEGARDAFSQTVKTAAGQAYTFSIDARDRPGENPNSCGIEVVWNGKVVSTIPPGADWKTYSVDVTGTGGNDALMLREPKGQSFDGVGALIDNLRLVAKEPAMIATATSAPTSLLDGAVSGTTGASAADSTTKASASKDGVTTALAAWTNGEHPLNSGHRTLGFAADAHSSAPPEPSVGVGGVALLRQHLAAVFADVGATSAVTPIHDDAARQWAQTLAQPRHA
jgi:hypothetical protein